MGCRGYGIGYLRAIWATLKGIHTGYIGVIVDVYIYMNKRNIYICIYRCVYIWYIYVYIHLSLSLSLCLSLSLSLSLSLYRGVIEGLGFRKQGLGLTRYLSESVPPKLIQRCGFRVIQGH